MQTEWLAAIIDYGVVGLLVLLECGRGGHRHGAVSSIGRSSSPRSPTSRRSSWN